MIYHIRENTTVCNNTLLCSRVDDTGKLIKAVSNHHLIQPTSCESIVCPVEFNPNRCIFPRLHLLWKVIQAQTWHFCYHSLPRCHNWYIATVCFVCVCVFSHFVSAMENNAKVIKPGFAIDLKEILCGMPVHSIHVYCKKNIHKMRRVYANEN